MGALLYEVWESTDCCSELCFVSKGKVKKLTQKADVATVAKITDLAELMSPAAVTETSFLQTPSNHSCSQLRLLSLTSSMLSEMDCVHMDR